MLKPNTSSPQPVTAATEMAGARGAARRRQAAATSHNTAAHAPLPTAQSRLDW